MPIKVSYTYDTSGLYDEAGEYILSDSKEQNVKSMTLVAAVRAGDNKKVRELAADPETDINTTAGMPLRAACATGNIDMVRVLIGTGAKVICEENSDAILSAAENGHADIVRYLALNFKFDSKLLMYVMDQVREKERAMTSLLEDMLISSYAKDRPTADVAQR